MRCAWRIPYKGMKNLSFIIWLCQTAAALFLGAGLYASDNFSESHPSLRNKPYLFDWGILWSGSWEEGTSALSDEPVLAGALQNRAEIKLYFLPPALTLRAQALDRRKIDFSLEPPWGNSESGVTNFTGGFYHKPTGSRLLYGVLDEWGLPARLRNAWIRSPPFAENHKPIIADLKTTASSTKEDEIYLYLSSPFINIFPGIKFRGFVSAQNEIFSDESFVFAPAVSAGMDLNFPKKNNLNIEAFYYGKTLAPLKAGKWFSETPPLPEREFTLLAGAFLFTCPDFSVSSDFALSETFAWGTDIYANLGVSFSPLLPFGTRERPLLISLAADTAGDRFVNRDGVNLKEGFRSAAKIEWRSMYSSLFRLNMTFRAPAFGEEFNRASAGIYYRFPSSARDTGVFRMTRVSFSAGRNSENLLKIEDSFSAALGININPRKYGIRSVFGINLSGSLNGLTDENESWDWRTADAGLEFIWSPNFKKLPGFQLRTKVGCNFFSDKDEKWDFSINSSIRFKNGRISLKAASPDFPEKWNWSITWRAEIKEFDKFIKKNE